MKTINVMACMCLLSLLLSKPFKGRKTMRLKEKHTVS